MKGTTGAQQDDAAEDDRQEMNELIESEPELYAADTEDIPKKKKMTQKERFKQEIQNSLNNNAEAPGVLSINQETDENIFKEIYIEDEISLEDPADERANRDKRAEFATKVHNSFTGPYPIDPTEFNHTDQGENYQFSTNFN